MHNQVQALDAVIGVHEAAGLIAGTPDFNFVFTTDFRFNYFAADRGGGFFAAAKPGAPGAVHVMKAGDARVEAEIFAEMAAHAFGE